MVFPGNFESYVMLFKTNFYIGQFSQVILPSCTKFKTPEIKHGYHKW